MDVDGAFGRASAARLLPLLDLTRLDEDDRPGRIEALCASAHTPHGLPAALRVVCAVLAAFVGFGGAGANAATLSWPGAAPCAATLQACIDAATAGDTVQIVTNASIAESVFLPRSITLEGGIGFSAQMAAGRSIEGNSTDSSPYNVAIRRIALTNARVAVSHHQAGTANIEIRRVSIVSTAATNAAGILVQAGSGGAATVRIADNRLRVATPSSFDAALEVSFAGNNGSALIDFNHLEAVGSAGGWGILAQVSGAATPTTTLINNEVRGRYGRAAIGVSEGLFSSTAGTITARVIGNAVIGRNRQGAGFLHVINNGSINTRIVNNTAVDVATGMSFVRWSGSAGTGSISGPVQNNLLANNNFGLFINPEFQSPVVENYNLVFGNNGNSYTPGANDVTADPLLRSSTDVRLRAGSPAVNAANSFTALDAYAASGVGVVDADGLRRFKASLADIGAYEFGDFSLRARADAPSGNSFVVNQALINGNPSARLFATVNAGPSDEPPLITDEQPVGVWYLASTSNNWRIFNQSPPSAAMPVGVEFNVFVPADGGGTFVHTATAGNLSGHFTTIDNGSLNNLPDRIVLATSNWNPGGTPSGIYNPHTTSVGYFGSSWFVLNNDFGAMTVGAAFNIYSQDPSPNAYVHTATSANSSGPSTILDHPLLNGTRCAQVHVTPRTGAHGDTTYDVFYDASPQRWKIYNHNSVAMADFAEFNVVIDAAQVAACAGVLFGDGFED